MARSAVLRVRKLGINFVSDKDKALRSFAIFRAADTFRAF